jgi:transposase InsO family protein
LDLYYHHFFFLWIIAENKKATLKLWHERLCHVSLNTIQKMFQEKAVNGLNLEVCSDTSAPLCADCMKGKMTRLPFSSGRNRANEIGQLIHSDVCGPIQVASPGGSRYYVIFKDDYSGWTVINFIKHKSEVEEKFKNYAARLRVKKGKSINTLRTDRGGEYVGKSFSDWLDKEGIRHEMSAAYTPQQNGVSESYNRTEMESTRCLLFARKVHAKSFFLF